MLNKMHALLRRHQQAMNRSLVAFKRTPWTSMVTVLVIALSLILPLLFWMLIGAFKPLADEWQQGKAMTLYLDKSFKLSDKNDVMGRIEATKGVARAVFVSASDSLSELEKQEGMHDVRRFLPENPLPDMIEVIPTGLVNTPDKIEQLYQALKQSPHVEQAEFNRDWVSQLYAILNVLTYLTWTLGVLFGLMVIFIIRNLLRVAAYEHHDEIQVLKLIGATDAFILRPFLYTGACLGALGALFAFVSGYVILSGLHQAFHALVTPGFASASWVHVSIQDALWCLLFGFCLGWLGAYLPLKHQLKHIEPCH